MLKLIFLFILIQSTFCYNKPNKRELYKTHKSTEELDINLLGNNMALKLKRPEFPTIKYEDYKAGLMEKDFVENDELPPKQFLEEKSKHDTIILTSYPRSGNTLLRGYLEKIMGLASGSDMDISKKLNSKLMDLGFGGEGLVDKRVWYVKTHFPERFG